MNLLHCKTLSVGILPTASCTIMLVFAHCNTYVVGRLTECRSIIKFQRRSGSIIERLTGTYSGTQLPVLELHFASVRSTTTKVSRRSTEPHVSKRDPQVAFGVMYEGKSIHIFWPLAAAKNASLLQAWTFGWTGGLLMVPTSLKLCPSLILISLCWLHPGINNDAFGELIRCYEHLLVLYWCVFGRRFCIPKGEIATTCVLYETDALLLF